MFKLPGIPTPQADPPELADFAELECMKHGNVSMRALIAALERNEENDYSLGVPEESAVEQRIEAAFDQVDIRIQACGSRYPFVIEQKGPILKMNPAINKDYRDLYCYLLLTTRLNMKDNRTFSGIDGTLLLEKVAAEVAQAYWGTRAESLVFGTSEGAQDFDVKIDRLCKKLNEGGGFKKRGEEKVTAKDGKLDVVVWKDFSDKKAGKLVGFGQCKTGTNWKDTLTQLQPDSFCAKWFKDSIAVKPVRIFFVSEALSRGSWYEIACDGGIVFDRCRIMDYGTALTPSTMKKVAAWAQHSMQEVTAE